MSNSDIQNAIEKIQQMRQEAFISEDYSTAKLLGIAESALCKKIPVVPSKTEVGYVCPNCGMRTVYRTLKRKQLPKERFCRKCGARLDWSGCEVVNKTDKMVG